MYWYQICHKTTGCQHCIQYRFRKGSYTVCSFKMERIFLFKNTSKILIFKYKKGNAVSDERFSVWLAHSPYRWRHDMVKTLVKYLMPRSYLSGVTAAELRRTWLKLSNIYFRSIKIFRNGVINERRFSNPHPHLHYENLSGYKTGIFLAN